MKKWIFDFSPNSEYKGLADSGIETFNDDKIKSLAREICQNSLDAVLEGKTAKVEFNLFEIDRENFPGFKSLKDSIEKAERYWGEGKEKAFLNNALRTLNQSKIKFLRISDFNTTGLTGINDNNVQSSRWLKLIKASGVSTKTGKSGGSFGIGKFASFACSNLRSVFYSSKNVDGEEGNLGVARLFSFADDNGNICDGRAFCGIDNSGNPERKLLNLDESFQRINTGTDIYISAFSDNPEWKGKLISSIIDSFLIAISSNKLEIKIQDEILGSKTLDYIFERYNQYFSDLTKNAYKVLTSNEAQEVNIEIKDYGYLKLRILQDSKLNKKIIMVKSMGMKIKEFTYNGHIYFSAICVIEGDKLNETLLRMENPAHNNWSSERMDTIEEKREADKLIRNIRDSIFDKINELFIVKDLDEINIDGLDLLKEMEDIHADDSLSGKGFNDIIVNVDITTKKAPRSILPNTYKSLYSEELENIEKDNLSMIVDEVHEIDNSILYKRKNKKIVNVNEKEGKSTLVRSRKTRIICLDKESSHYKMIFNPLEDALNGFFVFYKVDEQGSLSDMEIKSASLDGYQLEVRGNKIMGINFNTSERIKVNIKFIDKEYYSLEVRAYADKK